MRSYAEGPAADLGSGECWQLLDGAAEGRLTVSVREEPAVFPVEFQTRAGKILLRARQGEMLVELTINPSVALEATGRTATSEWSVVVEGTARELQTWSEIDASEREARRPWSASAQGSFVEIVPARIAGRRRLFPA